MMEKFSDFANQPLTGYKAIFGIVIWAVLFKLYSDIFGLYSNKLYATSMTMVFWMLLSAPFLFSKVTRKGCFFLAPLFVLAIAWVDKSEKRPSGVACRVLEFYKPGHTGKGNIVRFYNPEAKVECPDGMRVVRVSDNVYGRLYQGAPINLVEGLLGFKVFE